ncbi:hypothetical protein RclHR1_01610017 [Rhizophagus clarus]|uniref:Uncharacterized protein n=1 Tax=Rhizophagus clarus TaxID=94130 RepID=A0A2Z6R9L6_9GLOM|nr:hypothetical protein RclHR1_01610017 [Rhizophagus clarus]GES98074.1 hypothetical protein GLOIN_2v1880782 [Rhizophagus clarus]
MSDNNLPNNFSSNNVNDSNFQTASTQAHDTYTPLTYDNNSNNSITDQQPMSNNNVTYFPNHTIQQPNVASPNYNNQQQYQQPGISYNNDNHNYHYNYQQPMSNVVSNNNVTISSDNNQHASSNHINQQPTANHQDQNQHNILPLLNSFGISINSQATIIILPTNNLDNQNQLQQVLSYLNHPSSTKTRFQQ